MTPLTQEEFQVNMEIITQALQTSKMLLSTISQEDIERLRENIRMADTMAMFIIPPIQFDKSMKNLDEQRQLLDWVQDTKVLFETCLKT